MTLTSKPLKPDTVANTDDIEARIYPVQLGYRVVVMDGTDFYWHPGIFWSKQELLEWLKPQMEALADLSLPLSGEWMKRVGADVMYQDWYCHQAASNWEGYNPMTNRCHTAPTLDALKQKIDRIEAER